MNELMNWSILGTMAGATTVVTLIIQLVKGLFPKVDTRIQAFILSLVIFELVAFFTNGGMQEYTIAVFNAFLVTAAAMGTYSVTFKKLEDAKKDGGTE